MWTVVPGKSVHGLVKLYTLKHTIFLIFKLIRIKSGSTFHHEISFVNLGVSIKYSNNVVSWL